MGSFLGSSDEPSCSSALYQVASSHDDEHQQIGGKDDHEPLRHGETGGTAS